MEQDKDIRNKEIAIFIGEESTPFFNSDWNWLMKAWNNIANLSNDKITVDEMSIGSKSASIRALKIPYNKNKSFIEFSVVGDPGIKSLHDATYEVVSEFVKWYNKQ